MYFDVTKEKDKSLDDLISHKITLKEEEQIRQFCPLSGDKLIIMTINGKLYLYSYSKFNQKLLSDVGIQLEREEYLTALCTSKDERKLAFSSRLHDWKFGRIFLSSLNKFNERMSIGRVFEYNVDSVIEKDLFFTDMNFEMEIKGHEILCCFPNKNNPRVYLFSVIDDFLKLVGSVNPDCEGRFTRCFVLGKKLFSVDSMGCFVEIDFSCK